MKRILILLALVAILLTTITPTYAGGNLIKNGSFKQGFEHWEHYVMSKIVNKGKCGKHSVVLKNGFIRNTSFQMEGGKTYRLSFWYRGKVLTSILPPEDLQATKWTFYSREFVPDAFDTIWFMGNFGRGQIDCVKLKEVG